MDTNKRKFSHKGQGVCISGSSRACLVWINDRPVIGTADADRFPSLHKARIAARAYIDRHAGTGDYVDQQFAAA